MPVYYTNPDFYSAISEILDVSNVFSFIEVLLALIAIISFVMALMFLEDEEVELSLACCIFAILLGSVSLLTGPDGLSDKELDNMFTYETVEETYDLREVYTSKDLLSDINDIKDEDEQSKLVNFITDKGVLEALMHKNVITSYTEDRSAVTVTYKVVSGISKDCKQEITDSEMGEIKKLCKDLQVVEIFIPENCNRDSALMNSVQQSVQQVEENKASQDVNITVENKISVNTNSAVEGDEVKDEVTSSN